MSIRQAANLVIYIVIIGVNGAANALPINGQTTGELSDKYPSLFTPAGYVFSIWGLIYALLLAFVLVQALPGQRDNINVNAVGYLFVINGALNALWIVLWHYEFLLESLIVMVGILLTLIEICRRLGIGETTVPPVERWAIRLPFSVYLGWITVATVANVSVVLLDLGFDGGAFASAWTAVALAVATGIGLLAIKRHGDIAFGFVLVWAFVGIAVKQWGENTTVVAAAVIAAATLAATIFAYLLNRSARHSLDVDSVTVKESRFVETA